MDDYMDAYICIGVKHMTFDKGTLKVIPRVFKGNPEGLQWLRNSFATKSLQGVRWLSRVVVRQIVEN